jgi:hypothetical protein
MLDIRRQLYWVRVTGRRRFEPLADRLEWRHYEAQERRFLLLTFGRAWSP